MTDPMQEVSDVEQVLAAIRGDLRRGDYAKLETYSMQLEGCISQLLARLPSLSPAALARVVRAAEGNARCLDAAAQGFRAARRRLEDLGSAARVEAYDAQGRPIALVGGNRRLRITSNPADFSGGDQQRLNPIRL